MPFYRYYLFDAKMRISQAEVIECADDDHAEQWGRKILAANGNYRAVEIWDRERRIDRYPANYPPPAPDISDRTLKLHLKAMEFHKRTLF
jgi:hypothetical protein